jgi:nucleoside phosphorylase
LGNLSTPKTVQKLRKALHAKAKAEAGYRFYALYDKISREKERVSETKPEDRGATREAGPVLLSRARANAIIWDKAPLDFGTVASGEKLVDDVNFREKLKKLQPGPIAGDMEAWGLSAVCHEAQTQFIMVKGICDWGMHKEKDNQDIAARNACAFVLDALIV